MVNWIIDNLKMGRKYYRIMILFTNQPNGILGTLKMLSHLNVLKIVKNTQKSNLTLLGNPLQQIAFIQLFEMVKTVGTGLSGEHKIYQLLYTVTVLAYKTDIDIVHFLFDVLDSFGH